MEAPVNHPSTTRRFMASLRDFLHWLVFIVTCSAAVGALGMYVVHQRLDDEIRRHVEAKFQAHYTGLEVTVKSARRVAGLGVEVSKSADFPFATLARTFTTACLPMSTSYSCGAIPT
jgi:hypothetical protein